MTDFPDLKIKALVSFPANVYGGAGITVSYASGNYTITTDYSKFAVYPAAPSGSYSLVYNPLTGMYGLSPGVIGPAGPTGPTGPAGPTGPTGPGSGDVVGPASSVNNNIAVFSLGTGKLIKDGGKALADLAPFDALAYNGMQANGSCDVSQANGTSGVTAVDGTYTVDGWVWSYSATATCSAAQVTDAPPGYSSSIKVTVSAGAAMGTNDVVALRSPIEGGRIARLGFGAANAQSVSIGFWTKIHRTGAYSGSIRNSAHNRVYPFSFTQNVTDAWEFKTVTIPGDTTGTWLVTNGVGLDVCICLAGGSLFAGGTSGAWTTTNYLGVSGTTNGVAAISDTFQITGLIVLPGIELPSASRAPFIMRPYDQELALCKRYWQYCDPGLFGITSAATNFLATAWFPEMRAAPSIGLIGAPLANGIYTTAAFLTLSAVNASGATNKDAYIIFTCSTTATSLAGMLYPPVTQGKITLDARL